MWNYTLPMFGETFYDVALWFLIYSIMGWVVESIYISLCNRRLTNRGYIKGPICPIYGFGGTIIHTILRHFAGSYITIFIVGAVLATTLEYMTAMAMIRVFGCVWWDYTNKPFNYKGILCLESSVAWGMYAIMDMAFLKKFIFIIIHHVPVKFGKAIVIFSLVYYFSDFIVSTKKNRSGEIETEANNIMQYNQK